ncbi:hypothetical protein N748_11865 [Legionella pneumophila str. 121004]|nr:hypothetical protein N748_11865 [Legionella pneumophila str. 121004]ERH42004.1 hypothetical protein N750_02800 [Legionella pneumophila str. Leg01/53]ERI49073.1 hypothetical protein N749_06905 [Legionella pneumophila str. Leg01/20]
MNSINPKDINVAGKIQVRISLTIIDLVLIP